MTKSKDLPQVVEKHKKMYQFYNEQIKSYGDLANKLPKKMFYEAVADEFFVSTEYAAQVIGKMIKNESRRNHPGEQSEKR